MYRLKFQVQKNSRWMNRGRTITEKRYKSDKNATETALVYAGFRSKITPPCGSNITLQLALLIAFEFVSNALYFVTTQR